MAKSINFRSFNEGGEEVRFSSILFRQNIDGWIQKEKEKGNKINKEKAYEMIAEDVHISKEAVKKWYIGHNGPGDYQTVKQIASILGVDYKDIVVPAKEEPETLEQDFAPVGHDEKELLLQIYKLFVDYIYWFVGVEDESQALIMLENPEKERHDYIFMLYHFLDQIALAISNDTYSKLRKLITYLEIIPCSYEDGYMWMPDQWIKLNPKLKIFTRFLHSNGGSVENYLEEEEYKDVFHLIDEDIEEYSEDLTISKNHYNYPNMTSALYYERNNWNDYPIYELVVRETANTLILVMRDLFPQYFGEEQGDEENNKKSINKKEAGKRK